MAVNLLLMAGICASLLAVCWPPSQQGLSAAYYLNPRWHGDPWQRVIDSVVDDRGPVFRAARGASASGFSVEWTGYLSIDEADDYAFTTTSAGESWLLVDDTLLIANRGAPGLQQRRGLMSLARGLHRIRVKYVGSGEEAILRVHWGKAQGSLGRLPSHALLPTPTSRILSKLSSRGKVALPLLVGAWLLMVMAMTLPRADPTDTTVTRPTQRRRLAALFLVSVLIPFWQSTFVVSASKLDDSYQMRAAGGLYDMGRYIYFYYYLGIFPLTTVHRPLVYDGEAAEAVARDHPDSLTMDLTSNIRGGDSGRIWLFWPAAILKGEPSDTNLAWPNAVSFSLALIALLVAAWHQGRMALGVLMVALIGSHPFQLFEQYAQRSYTDGGVGNLFGLAITTTLVVLALHFGLICGSEPSKKHLFILPAVTGVFLGTIRHVRSEFVVALLSALFCYFTASRIARRVKAGLALLLLTSFWIASQAWNAHFDFKLEQAKRFIESVGGTPSSEGRDSYHTLWHPLFCGLGDFGAKYGYAWDDVAAYNYAGPILAARKGQSWSVGALYSRDERGYFPATWRIPGYEAVLREKIVSDIMEDPAWFAGVLMRRLARLLTDVAPVRLAVGARWLTLPVAGALFVPTVALLALKRQWDLLRLLCFSLPLTLPALVIYSGGGMTYYSIYLPIAVAVHGAVLWSVLRRRVEAWRRRQ